MFRATPMGFEYVGLIIGQVYDDMPVGLATPRAIISTTSNFLCRYL